MPLHVSDQVYCENSGVGNHLVHYVNENRLDRGYNFFQGNAKGLAGGNIAGRERFADGSSGQR